MKLRIDKLAEIDPARVPLPNGTEVTTGVDRMVNERIVRQGAVGRIKAIDGSSLIVRIVGVGDVRYLREELTPRKSGQLDFAIRREVAWQALRPAVVLETVVGSRAWGLADESSDTDVRGVFVLPFPWTTALGQPPSDLASADGSTHYWEVGKAFRQAMRADPNTLETLLLPSAVANAPMGQWILDIREAFVSSEIYGTFGRYALSQLKRLSQGVRLAEHRELLLGWLRETPSLSLDQAASALAASAPIDGPTDAEKALRAKEYIKQLYSSMYDQGLLAERNFESLVSFSQDGAHGFDLPRELRPKNAYNLLRLLATATTWLRTGTPEFEVRGALRDELMSIKRQEVELRDVLSRAEELAEELEASRASTALPKSPDISRIDELLRRIREDAARRWLEKESGVFGSDCPEFPLAERKN
tara:strand:+ start:9441 stop:10694 length:1254 start_codon:yes stop_codon:yes gene_type:complete